MTRSQLDAFLNATLRVAPGHHPLFLPLARTGVRIGEAIAFQWPDIDLVDREIRVERGFSARQIETPKTGHGRTVDMSQQLARPQAPPGRPESRDAPAWMAGSAAVGVPRKTW